MKFCIIVFAVTVHEQHLVKHLNVLSKHINSRTEIDSMYSTSMYPYINLACLFGCLFVCIQ